jgi:hypothetical protein
LQIDLAEFEPTAPDFKDKIQANCEPREFWYWVGKKEKDGKLALVVKSCGGMHCHPMVAVLV